MNKIYNLTSIAQKSLLDNIIKNSVQNQLIIIDPFKYLINHKFINKNNEIINSLYITSNPIEWLNENSKIKDKIILIMSDNKIKVSFDLNYINVLQRLKK